MHLWLQKGDYEDLEAAGDEGQQGGRHMEASHTTEKDESLGVPCPCLYIIYLYEWLLQWALQTPRGRPSWPSAAPESSWTESQMSAVEFPKRRLEFLMYGDAPRRRVPTLRQTGIATVFVSWCSNTLTCLLLRSTLACAPLRNRMTRAALRSLFLVLLLMVVVAGE